jgi:hypothetical protein
MMEQGEKKLPKIPFGPCAAVIYFFQFCDVASVAIIH